MTFTELESTKQITSRIVRVYLNEVVLVLAKQHFTRDMLIRHRGTWFTNVFCAFNQSIYTFWQCMVILCILPNWLGGRLFHFKYSANYNLYSFFWALI